MKVQDVELDHDAGGRFRWVVAILLLTLTTINYADRSVIGLVATDLEKTFHLTIAQYGIIASAFGWVYVPFMFIGGWILASTGPKRMYIWAVLLWSLFIALVPLASGFAMLLVFRALFGGAEGSIFPTGSKLIERWFPTSERSRASAFMTAGIPLGSLVVTPLAVFLTIRYSWRMPFYVLAAIAVVWVIVAIVWLSDNPEGSGAIKSSEQTWILRQRSISTTEVPRPVPWKQILGHGSLWATGWAFFSSAYVLYFMLAFLPSYFVKARHVPYSHLSLLGSLPWAAMVAAALISGVVSDRLFRTRSQRTSRSLVAGMYLIVTGILMLLTLSTNSTGLIVALITIASFFNFLANPLFFVIPIDIGGVWAGQASGFSTALASSAGIVAPLLTGFIVQTTHSFTAALLIVGLVVISGGLVSMTMIRPDRIIPGQPK